MTMAHVGASNTSFVVAYGVLLMSAAQFVPKQVAIFLPAAGRSSDGLEQNGQRYTRNVLLGPPVVVPFYMFFWEGSPTKRDCRKNGYPYSNPSTGGPRLSKQRWASKLRETTGLTDGLRPLQISLQPGPRLGAELALGPLTLVCG